MSRRLPALSSTLLSLLLFVASACGGGSAPGARLDVIDLPHGHGWDFLFEEDVVDETTWDVPGQFGTPCESNEDCDSGLCIEGVDGTVCTMPCTTDCPPGWNCRTIFLGPDPVSLCVPDGASLCKPCTIASQCPGGLCAPVGDRNYCTKDCSTNDCPNGYVCRDLAVDGVDVRQCLPASGACDCNVTSDGVERPCWNADEAGSCLGIETCRADTGWSACSAATPSPETCNGADDDCDGVADDDVPEPREACRIPDPLAPQAIGCDCTWMCQGAAGWGKVGRVPEPETCNYLDDDCDGATDEGYTDGEGHYVHVEHCGQCGNRCQIPYAAEVACDGAKGVPACIAVACNEGTYKVGDSMCLPLVSKECSACADDANCGTLGDLCLDIGGGRFCGRDCSDAAVFGPKCPDGYVCQDVGDAARQCVPVSGSCDCKPGGAAAGLQRTCLVTNAAGTCLGVETCDPSVGWGGCTASEPEPEACNGLDDDCDGLTDEAFPALGAVCSAGEGACRVYGVVACTDAGDSAACDAVPRDPVPETCDHEDNDCDGAADEDWLAKGKFCTVGTGECVANGVWTCDPAGGSDLVCDAPAIAAVPEACNGRDDDCDGAADEDWPEKGWFCQAGQGACGAVGVWVCAADGTGVACSAEAGVPSPEVCNGRDDDCDGAIDEDFPDKGAFCSTGLGQCHAGGVLECSADGGGVVCTAVAGTPVAEACNGLDDDCDGSTDEDWPAKGSVCVSGAGACLGAGVFVCTGDGAGIECSAKVGLDVPESCDGIDNDCDGMTDETWPQKGRPCEAGLGACRAAGVFACTADGQAVACDAVAGQPAVEVCNGGDDDCDGGTDEDWPTKGGVCSAGTGTCVRSGTLGCTADGASLVCSAIPGQPAAADVCDYLDDDCDGGTDEDFVVNGLYVRDSACGNCYTDCTKALALPHATGRCDASSGEPVCRLVCDPGWFDLDLVPDDGCEFRLDPLTVYVSASDPAADALPGCGRGPVGTGEGNRPCSTIEAGIGEALASGSDSVHVADGVYYEPVRIPDGLALRGGYRADSWVRHADTTLTAIRGSGALGDHRFTVMAEGTAQATEFEGFQVYGPIVATPGANSYALYLRDATPKLSVSRNQVFAGTGGPGSAGAAAPQGTFGIAGEGRDSPLGPCAATVGHEGPLAIPDGTEVGLVDTLVVSADPACTVATLSVDVTIRHPLTQEILVDLVGPDGTVVRLWDLEAGMDLVGAWPYSLKLATPFSPLVGKPVAGVWSLVVTDKVPGTGGRVDAWSLSLNAPHYDALLTDNMAPCDSSDNRQFENAGRLACSGDDVSGGRGGGTVCAPSGGTKTSALDGSDGQAADPLLGGGAGTAGGAGWDGLMYYMAGLLLCQLPPNPMIGSDGTDGADGLSGEGGAGCAALDGAVIDGHWSGGAGLSGSPGGAGGGGGGGGAGGGGMCTDMQSCKGRDRLGGHGGGGGSGGCGGPGGAVGGPGGGSFGIFIAGGQPSIDGNYVIQGIGGSGGAGGSGGSGGPGGLGGTGGKCRGKCWCFSDGGRGGNGGDGGSGGGGGGGCGGASVGVYGAGIPDKGYCKKNVVFGGAGGAGGPGGFSGGQSGSAGGAGAVLPCKFQ